MAIAMLWQPQVPAPAHAPEEHTMAMADFDLAEFIGAARAWRPADYDEKMKRRQRFLEADIVGDVTEELKKHYPETWQEMVPVVKNVVPLVVGERAKAFKRSRFRLERDGKELADDDEQQVLFERVWRESHTQIRLEELNRYAEAMCTAFLRIGWDGVRHRLVPTVFMPQHVYVTCSPERPTDLDAAVGVALRVASDTGITAAPGRERFEFWSATEHFLAHDSGEVLPPAEDNQAGENPYALVPIIPFLSQPPDKGLFVTAGEDLIAATLALSAAASDLDTIGKHQGFGELYIKAGQTEQKELGAEKLVRSPGRAQLIPIKAEVVSIQPQPLIDQLNEVGKDALKHTAMMHGLPAGSVLSEARTVAAAEALAIERISLEEYREESVARYQEAVERLWIVMRKVWNVRAAPLGLPTFDESLRLRWYPGDLTFRSSTVPAVVPEGLTLNEFRARLGEGPLRKQDGSLDERGNLLMADFRAQVTAGAAAASVATRLGAFDFGRAAASAAPAREPPARPAGEGGAARPGIARPAPAQEKAADTALNGAQVQAAAGIVKDVAAGLLPRDSGVGMLEVFFRISSEEAEKIMGEVGKGFTPAAPVESAPAAPPTE